MSLVAQIENGKVVESASQTSLKKANQASSSGMDKDAFLQILVAQMKYQDPLEPTSNTEYISQYAQFSQVEQMQNMAVSMDLQRASALVGKEVYVKTTATDGSTNYVQGKVDYVSYEGNKAYLSIDGSLYSIDDLDTVADATYLAAYNKASDFAVKMNKLPGINGVDISYADKIDEVEEIYNGMNDYEKTFVASDYVTALGKYVERLKEVRLAARELEETQNDVSAAEEDGE